MPSPGRRVSGTERDRTGGFEAHPGPWRRPPGCPSSSQGSSAEGAQAAPGAVRYRPEGGCCVVKRSVREGKRMAKPHLAELRLCWHLPSRVDWPEPVRWLNWSGFAAGRGVGVSPGLVCGLDLAGFHSNLETVVLVPPAAPLRPATQGVRISAAGGGAN